MSWLPIPTKNKMYQFQSKSRKVWIISNDADPPAQPTFLKIRTRVTKMPQSAFETARLILELEDVDAERSSQVIVRKVYEILVSVTSTSNEDWRVLTITREDGKITIQFVYDENADDCTPERYSTVWNSLTGKDRIRLTKSLPSASVAEAMATDSIVLKMVQLEEADECPTRMPPPVILNPPPVLEDEVVELTVGDVVEYKLKSANFKISKSMPQLDEVFYKISDDKLIILLPKVNYCATIRDASKSSITLTLDDGTVKYNLVLTGPDDCFFYVQSEYYLNVAFNENPTWSLDNLKYALTRARNFGIKFVLVLKSFKKSAI